MARSEPRYDLRTGNWSHSCPCISQMQVDPECPWHGRAEFREVDENGEV